MPLSTARVDDGAAVALRRRRGAKCGCGMTSIRQWDATSLETQHGGSLGNGERYPVSRRQAPALGPGVAQGRRVEERSQALHLCVVPAGSRSFKMNRIRRTT